MQQGEEKHNRSEVLYFYTKLLLRELQNNKQPSTTQIWMWLKAFQAERGSNIYSEFDELKQALLKYSDQVPDLLSIAWKEFDQSKKWRFIRDFEQIFLHTYKLERWSYFFVERTLCCTEPCEKREQAYDFALHYAYQVPSMPLFEQLWAIAQKDKVLKKYLKPI
jgi:hypothetical protein